MDRRQRKTQNAVFSAFEELISKKRYDEITVQEIIDLADIGRTTFYAHFAAKDSVLDSLCSELFVHIFDEELSEEETHDFSKSVHSEDNMLSHILYHLKEDKTRYKRLFTGKSADVFWARFHIRFKEMLDKKINEGKWKVRTNLPESLYIDLYTSSFIESVKWWFKNFCRETPEQIVAYFEDFCAAK